MQTYRDLNDYEIMYMIGESDDAKELLFDKYRPVIINVAKKYRLQGKKMGLEMDDLIQEGYLGLYSAIKNYDQNDKSLFYTYALLSIRSKIVNALRANDSQKKKCLNESISLSKCISYDSDSTFLDFIVDETAINPDLILEENILFDFIRGFIYSLDIDTACVFELSINGFNNSDIGKLLDCSSKVVSNILFRIKKRLHNIYNL